MSEITEKEKTEVPKTEQESAAPAPEQTKQEEVRFPSLEKGPAVFYESDRKEVWVGVPFEQVSNPIYVMAALDRAKFDALIHLGNFQIEQARRQSLQVSPVGKRLNNTLKDLFGKAKSLVS